MFENDENSTNITAVSNENSTNKHSKKNDNVLVQYNEEQLEKFVAIDIYLQTVKIMKQIGSRNSNLIFLESYQRMVRLV